MGFTFAEKALARAAGLPAAPAGQIVDARPDLALSHDNSAAIARLFREIGASRVHDPGRLAIMLDHAVPAPTTQHAANHAEIRRFVSEQGIGHFYEAGRGICHQVASEEALVWPGQLALGADSHTTHLGWLGAFAAGIGRSEMAAIWATGELWLRVPETIRIDLEGTLPPYVAAKDLALWLMRALGTEAAIYAAAEIGGPGLQTLSIASRMVLPNMLAEAGVKNAYLTPDEAVFDWLAAAASGRSGVPAADLRPAIAAGALYPDADAVYTRRMRVDLAAIEPSIACPHRPDNVVPLGEVAGTHVDQAFIGTCTNGRLEDLAAAAAVLRGPEGRVRPIAPGTRLLVIPASSQVLAAALAAGYIETFVAAGAMIGTPGCGPCMGNHLGIPAPGEVTISSANRNFRGRMGTPESEIYLASPAVVAASALAGHIVNAAELAAVAADVRPPPPTPPPARGRGASVSGRLEGGATAGKPAPGRASSTSAGSLSGDEERGASVSGRLEGGATAGKPAPGRASSTIAGSLSGDEERGASVSGRLEGAAAAGKPAPGRASSTFAGSLSGDTDLVGGESVTAMGYRGTIPAATGRAWKYGDDVNTDVIFPGKYTYTVTDPAEMARHALEDLDPGFAALVQPGDIIVAGRNWGCGSSREQAVTCLRGAGVSAIVAASFARIYFRNAVNNGILPIACPAAAAAIAAGETVTVDLGRGVVGCAAGEFPFPPLSPSLYRIIAAGGLVPMLREALAQ